MIIKAYGLFWRVDEINWNPGAGNARDVKAQFRLLGRDGKNKPGLRVADFRSQHGIYILYGDLGAHYVGLARRQSLGNRLKQHLTDGHQGLWDRFSWFGFRTVLGSRDEYGFQKLKVMAAMKLMKPDNIIGDIEALLIKAMALNNIADMKFAAAKQWMQIRTDEIDKYCCP